MNIPIIPQHATKESAGADLISTKTIVINPGETVLIPTDSYVPSNLPVMHCLKLYARSSLAYKKDLILKNCVGIIDRDYKDEIKVMLFNVGSEPQIIEANERVAQLIAEPYINVFPVKDSVRAGGFGSTGK